MGRSPSANGSSAPSRHTASLGLRPRASSRNGCTIEKLVGPAGLCSKWIPGASEPMELFVYHAASGFHSCESSVTLPGEGAIPVVLMTAFEIRQLPSSISGALHKLFD